MLLLLSTNPHYFDCHLYVRKALHLSGNAHVCEFTRWRFSRLLVMEPAKCQCECKGVRLPTSA